MKSLTIVSILIIVNFYSIAQNPNFTYDYAQDVYSIEVKKNGVYWIDTISNSNGSTIQITYDDLGNKTSLIEIPAPPLAELRLPKAQIPDTLGVGTNMSFLVEWSNSGTHTAQNFITKAILSSDSLPSLNDIDCGITNFPNIFPSQYYTNIPTLINIPLGTPDSMFYYLIIKIDDGELITEYSDSNNLFIKQVYITGCPTIALDTPIVQADVCGLSNGRIILNPDPIFNIEWYNGITDNSIGNLSAGTYSYTLINKENGCRYTDSIEIAAFATLQMLYTINNENCNQTDGSITLTPNSGTPPYTYQWTNGDTTSSIFNLNDGTYDVFISDSAGCQNLYNLVVNETPSLNIQFNTIQPLCNQDNGSASATVTGGLIPYVYLWSTGDTGISINNLNGGNYSLIITDYAGCTTTKTIQLETEELPEAEIIRSGTSLLATILNFPNPSGFAFFWSNGATTQSIDINLFQSATYWVEVVNPQGCYGIDTFYYEFINPIDTVINSIEDFVAINGFGIYPNPSDENALVNVKIGNKEINRIKVFNALGQLMHEQAVVGSVPYEIKLKGSYGVGTYLVAAYKNDVQIGQALKMLVKN